MYSRPTTVSLRGWCGGLLVAGLLLGAPTLEGGEPPGKSAPAAGSVEPEDRPPEEGRRSALIDALLETRPQADARPILRLDLERRVAEAYFVGHVEWRFAYEGRPVWVSADRFYVEVRLPPRGEAAATEFRGGAAKAGGETPSGDRPGVVEGGGLRRGRGLDLRSIQDFRFYADGNVRVEIPGRSTYLEADSFYYEHVTARGVARNARLKVTYEAAQGMVTALEAKDYMPTFEERVESPSSFRNSPLVVRADLLRMRGFEDFSGTGVEVTTCDFGIPHYSIRAAAVQVYPVEQEGGVEGEAARDAARETAEGAPYDAASREPAPSPGEASGRPSGDDGAGGPAEGGTESRGTKTSAATPGDDLGDVLQHRDFIIDPDSTWLTLLGHRVAPLPLSKWDTRWETHMPLRSAALGHSSKFGYLAGADWNLNYFLSLLPRSALRSLGKVGEDARLGFETNTMSDRGFGYGPHASYGTRPGRWQPWQSLLEEWTYYGEAQYYHVDDHGEEDRSTGLPVPREERYWGHVWHRQSLPYLGLLDLEYSKLSDRAFLGEYFEPIAKEGKEQETLAYLRRNVTDAFGATALFQVRTNDFQTQTERLPEGKAFLLEQPVLRLWTLPATLTTSLGAQAAYLNVLEDDALGIDPRAFPRYDLANEWTLPFALGRYLNVRPFGLLRLTYYGETLDPDRGSEDRATFGAGVTVSQGWSRVFHFDGDSFASRVLGIPVLRHDLVPRFTYLNIFSNDLPSEDLIQVDATDRVDLQESFAISLRNELFTRVPVPGKAVKARPLLRQRDVELVNSAEETRPILDSDVSLVLYTHPHRDNGGDRSSTLLLDNTISLFPRLYLRGWFELDPNESFANERIDASATYEAVARSVFLTVGDRYTRHLTDLVYGTAQWRINEKWGVEGHYSYDLETRRSSDLSFVLNRVFHRFVLSVEYSVDFGENRNVSLYFKFSPLELWSPRGGNVRRL